MSVINRVLSPASPREHLRFAEERRGQPAFASLCSSNEVRAIIYEECSRARE